MCWQAQGFYVGRHCRLDPRNLSKAALPHAATISTTPQNGIPELSVLRARISGVEFPYRRRRNNERCPRGR